jgi:hypothetical protein
MATGKGIEHPQMDAVAALFTGSPPGFAPTADLMTPEGKTPNQRALACAIALAWARQSHGQPPPMSQKDAVAQTRDLFQDMATFGHQAVGPNRRCEEGAPDPHAALWMAALTTILREARLQKIGELLEDALGYFADHVALCRAFWTPAGVRMPCARAKVVGDQPLRPNWGVDSSAYATINGLPKRGLEKPDPLTPKILQDSAALFPQIVERSQKTALKLGVPIRRWRRADGGFVAAMVEDVPMVDRCSWLIVDGDGTILDADDNLGSLTVPAGAPLVIGGGAAPPPPGDHDLPTLAAEVRALVLPRKQNTLKENAARAIEQGRIADALPLLTQFGIGEGQPQAATWKAVIAELRRREKPQPSA